MDRRMITVNNTIHQTKTQHTNNIEEYNKQQMKFLINLTQIKYYTPQQKRAR